jgi:hypothetical protein
MSSNKTSPRKNHADCILVNPPDDFCRYPYLGFWYLAATLLLINNVIVCFFFYLASIFRKRFFDSGYGCG